MANVTEQEMENYLRTFQDEYVRSVEQYIPQELRKRLLRYSLLPTSVLGFVSTQLGAGYEYRTGEPGIKVERHSRRIEEIFVGGPPWLAKLGPMFAIGGTNTGFARLTLEGAFPFRFTSEAADVDFYEVRFKAGTWQRDVLYAHLFANRLAEFWSEAEAVRRAKDEVLTAQLDLHQLAVLSIDLGTYLRRFKERTVLVLGSFDQGRSRLEAIRDSLTRAGYNAVLLDEIPEQPSYDLRQKFQAVAAVCRFLVFEDSNPSGHIAEMVLGSQLDSIRIILREGERKSTFMTQGLGLTSTVVREWSYAPEDLDVVLVEAVEWAEGTFAELAKQRQTVYPWLAPDEPSESSEP